jgi:Transglycosylase SLT domain
MTTPSAPPPALARAIDPTVLSSIRQASADTSVDFGFLMAQAAQESGFNSDAKSATSSATGLFQFVDSTWLDMVKRFGAKYGVGQLAQQITEDANGKPSVRDPALRRQILDLRRDPALSAALAGEYAKLNQDTIEHALGHKLQRADLYMAHFLGAAGATSFLKAVETKGSTIAANLLPEAASANRAIFYDQQTGRPRSVGEIYHMLAAKIDAEASALTGLDSGSTVADDAAQAPAFAASGMSAPLNWSGVKLSPQLIDMLSVVAMAALKMTEKPSPAPYAPAPAAQPRERRSI